MMIKDIQTCTGFQNYIKIQLDQYFLSLHPNVLPNFFLASILRLLFYLIKAYNDKSTFFSGKKTFWTALSNRKVVHTINNINSRKMAYFISTFDFSALFVNINHSKIQFVWQEAIHFSLGRFRELYCYYKIWSKMGWW